MYVEFQLLDIDELCLGFHSGQMNDENGDAYFIEFGFLIFSVTFKKYHS